MTRQCVDYEAVEMPDRVARTCHVHPQNNGVLSKKRRDGEYKALSDEE